MVKSKPLGVKLRQYYKGASTKHVRAANDEEMKAISDALLECLPKRSSTTFKCRWQSGDVQLRLVIGLSASLRLLKRGQTKALILCSTAATHLMNLLSGFTSKLEIPMIVAGGLINLAPTIKAKTLLIVSLVDARVSPDQNFYQDKDPRPRPIESSVSVESFNKMIEVLESKYEGNPEYRYTFKMPQTIQVKTSGRSQEKKHIRKKQKLEAALTN